MPDIDVGVLALTSPPPSAPRATYRPAVTVRNNGVADAVASGSLFLYDLTTGLYVASFSLGPATIPPGQTRTLQSSTTWKPALDVIGHRFMFYGSASCPGDMFPPNDQLSPVYVDITGEEPPPPPIEAHASQHEDGASDEISAEGLSGQLAEPQTPSAHAPAHAADGADQVDVSGLPGVLAEDQPPAVHNNLKHTVPYCALEDAAALVAGHNVANPAHEISANLEHVANKDQPNGYPALDQNGKVKPCSLANVSIQGGFLKHDPNTLPELSWSEGVAPPYGPPIQCQPMQPDDPGTSDEGARADHRHQECGGFAGVDSAIHVLANTPSIVLRAHSPHGLIYPPCHLRHTIFGFISTLAQGSPILWVRVGCAAASGTFTDVWYTQQISLPTGLSLSPFRLTIDHTRPTAGDESLMGSLFATAPDGLPSPCYLHINDDTISWYDEYFLIELTITDGSVSSWVLGGVSEHVRHGYPGP